MKEIHHGAAAIVNKTRFTKQLTFTADKTSEGTLVFYQQSNSLSITATPEILGDPTGADCRDLH